MSVTTTSNSKTILVTGATGNQGGAVVRRLLDNGYPVRAFVRDSDQPAAKEIEALGAELVAGDFDDRRSLDVAVQGVYGVFSAQPGDIRDPEPDVNVRRGHDIVDAAAAAGVAHLVYSSAGAVNRGSAVQHFESMAEVEAHIDASGVPATVLRPVFFMENWSYLMPQADNGERVGSLALDADTPLQMIAVADIGRIAADAFDHHDEFVGTKLEIAGDELTVRQIAETFTAVDGVPARFTRKPIDELRNEAEQLANFFDWLNKTGYQADINSLRRRWPDLVTLETWLRGKR
jgi:uncharacterized protein YbjT (DUF2867 family)